MKRLLNLLTLPTRKRVPVGATPADVMHRENKWKLLRYRPIPELPRASRTPLLLIPSLINRHYVLDLMPGKSFVEWLVDQGHDVWIIDWGTPGDEDRYVTFDEICDGAIGRAVRKVAATSPSGKTHVLGYCLGGTLAAIHAAARPEHIAGLIGLAAPVSFGEDGLLASWTRSPQFDVNAVADATGLIPWQLMQASFQMLRPTLNLSKAVHVIDKAWDDPFLDGFLALETWANDNVSFPGQAYARYIDALYRNDEFARGQFRLSGRPARLDALACPILSVTFTHDNIVPLASAQALVQQASSTDKTELELPGGHVGAVVSKAAAGRLWPVIHKWLVAHDVAPKAVPAEAGVRPEPVEPAREAPVSEPSTLRRPNTPASAPAGAATRKKPPRRKGV
ncbi:MAG: alpha/beta fold hydrolase [Myxococcales bacterium]|nr:alpha/beta fold hydrolase [Myxococcales bacterium]